jgi:hypothetical protein
MKRVLVALLSVVVFGLVVGCKAPVDVVGKWAQVDGPDTMEFVADGTYKGNLVYDSQAFQKDVAGKYTVSGDKVTLTSSGDAKESMVWVVSLSNGVLTVTYKNGGSPKLDGSSTTYKKAG